MRIDIRRDRGAPAQRVGDLGVGGRKRFGFTMQVCMEAAPLQAPRACSGRRLISGGMNINRGPH